jgi:hypothetical protein
MLLYTATITPFRIAFFEYDDTLWVSLDSIVDVIFAVDIFSNFFYAYYDDDYNLITDRKRISRNYLFSWFLIDVVAVIPISLILQSGQDYNSLARLARLPRLYRLIKMTKLVRMLKIVKERNKLLKNINEVLKISHGLERLLYVGFIFLLLTHITSCLWYIPTTLEDDPNSWLRRYGFMDSSIYEVSNYFV